MNNEKANGAVKIIIKELFDMDYDVVGVNASGITLKNNLIQFHPIPGDIITYTIEFDLSVLIGDKSPAQKIVNNINNAWNKLKK